MKLEKKMLFFLTISLLFVFISMQVSAEDRNIYIGDIIKLEISRSGLSIDHLREKFQEFEIVKIEEKENNYIIEIRTFEPGIKTVQIADKEIEIVVKSTLEDMERDDIYQGNMEVLEGRRPIPWKYILAFIFIICIAVGGNVLWNYYKKVKEKPLSAYRNFMFSVENISFETDDYFVKLTYYFKRYLEKTFSCQIRGKTSGEIINEIKDIRGVKLFISDIQNWLESSDYYKYTEALATLEEKKELTDKLKVLVKKIEETKEG
ncbi:MAG: hypothetical protein ACOCRL_01580 [Bacillota bacterium]